MSKRGIVVLAVAVAVLLPLLGVAGYTATTRWLLAGPPDECDLLSRQEVEHLLRSDDIEVASRHALPQPDGGWHYTCTYARVAGSEEVTSLAVTVLTGPFARDEHVLDPSVRLGKPLSGIGDEAWASDRGAQQRSGDTKVQVAGEVDNATLTREAHEQALRAVSGRLSTLPGFPESDLSGVCDRLDMAALGRHAGAELPIRRGLVRENGDTSCWFAGPDALFAVDSTTDEDHVATAKEIGPTNLRDWKPGESILFVAAGRRYDVTFRPAGAGTPADPAVLSKLVVDAFEACGDDLARC